MRFVLQLRGSIPSVRPKRGRSEEKHALRIQVHQQLTELWRTHPYYRMYTDEGVPRLALAEWTSANGQRILKPKKIQPPPDMRPTRFRVVEIAGRRFAPLISSNQRPGYTCRLGITFFRPGLPGGAVGDIDNRIKMVIDALRMPREPQEVSEGDHPETMYCLLEDDSILTGFAVETLTLLTPGRGNDYAELIIDVEHAEGAS